MINHKFIRQSLMALAPAMFLLFCCSTSTPAQTPSDAQVAEPTAKVVFKEAPVKNAVLALGENLKLNVVFDDGVRDSERLTIELKDVSFEQALKIILVAKRLQARIIEEKTIIVFPDNATNRERYAQYEIWPVKSEGKK